MMVNGQNIDSLTGNAGLQLRFHSSFAGIFTARSSTSPPSRISPVRSSDHDHSGDGASAPRAHPGSGETGTYGKVAAGLAARIGGTVSATVNAETTFARDGGNDLVVSGGIKVGL